MSDTINVDYHDWQLQQKRTRHLWIMTPITIVTILWGAAMCHIPKVISVPTVKTVEVVKWKEYKGIDPDELAKAAYEFQACHDRYGRPYSGVLGQELTPDQYKQKWPLEVRIEVRRRLNLLEQ